MANVTVNALRLTPAPERLHHTGLIGWLHVIVDGAWAIDGIALRRTRDGRLALSFPSRRDRAGHQHPYVIPVHEGVRRELERQVLKLIHEEVQVAP